MTRYDINDTTGNTAIDAGTDYELARRRAQAHADATGLTTYLVDHDDADDDYDYDVFEPA